MTAPNAHHGGHGAKQILALALAASLAACANGGDYGTQLPGQAGSNEPGVSFTALGACEQAMLLAALIDPEHDTVTDLDQAVERCDTYADWSAASAKYPDALDGADPRTFAQNRCAYGEGLANEPLCLEVGQPGS